MGRISRIFESRSKLTHPDDFFKEALGLWTTATGKSVSPATALHSTAVYRALWLISMAMATMPVHLYERLAEGRRKALDDNLYWILHEEPNPEMSAPAFYSTLQGHVDGWGNAYAEIQTDPAGRPVALWPLRPDRTRMVRARDIEGLATSEIDDRAAGDIVYETHLPGSGQVSYLRANRVLHIPNWGYNGMVGYSSVRMLREAIALGLAAEEYGGRFFGNDATPNLVMLHPKELKDAARKNLRESWETIHQGLSNKHRIGILEEGITLQQIGLSNEDSQFLQTRKFQVIEVSRIFGVPPHLLYDLDNAHFNNIEHNGIEFNSLSMAPRAVMWEHELKRKLIPQKDRRRFYVKFDLNGLQRGDFKGRMEGYSIAMQNGMYNADECREFEDMNPQDGGVGKKWFKQVNMIPVDYFFEDGPAPKPEDNQPGVQASRRAAKRPGARAAIAKSYRRVFADAAARVYRRERNDVMAAARKYRSQRAAGGFDTWLDGYYKDYPARAARDLAPAFHSLGEAIHTAAADEISAEANQEAEVQAAVQEHVEGAATRMAARNRGKIQAITDSADDETFLDELDSELASWEEAKPNRLALWETVRVMGMVAGVVWAANGFKGSKWRAGPDACPICLDLDGTTVEFGKTFADESDTLEAGGQTLSPGWSATTPPIHDGCECDIEPD